MNRLNKLDIDIKTAKTNANLCPVVAEISLSRKYRDNVKLQPLVGEIVATLLQQLRRRRILWKKD